MFGCGSRPGNQASRSEAAESAALIVAPLPSLPPQIVESIEIIEASDAEHFAAGKALIEEYAQSLGVDLCFQNFAEELAGLTKHYAPPCGCLLLARQAKNIAGCVAIRNLSGATCEMKRLYVPRAHRGTGIGRLLAEAAIKRAKQLGYARMALDTLPTMVEAQALYASLRFREIKGYYRNPLEGVRYMARCL